MALVLGGIGGYLVVQHVLEINFVVMPGIMALVVTLSVLATVAFGLISTWTALSVRPARLLRAA
ncbi:hypothetical protein JCM17845_03460 [Iodidimonas gelatinilytica]|uniref:ABC3 transporter permease protein domain-containing protein n=1 Tax=Iodidimonas gelatinilytica TaxID=1236966 RepID=A0A5A7MUN9_9PROT|nr:hypothetical protein [Iodidimonas gelatinilytica]GEQ99722.1 hypothetical protein JCM17845_03460 [Iodidimonas gelatinilytica]